MAKANNIRTARLKEGLAVASLLALPTVSDRTLRDVENPRQTCSPLNAESVVKSRNVSPFSARGYAFRKAFRVIVKMS